METINENVSVSICASFKDEDDTAVTPFSAEYTLYDKFSGTIRATGTINTPQETEEIFITSTENAILDENNRYEIAILFIEFTYNGGVKAGNGEYAYKILNLSKT